MAEEKLHFESLDDVLKHFAKYESQIAEFTGHHPKAPIGPLDVVKIVKRVFFSDKPPEGDVPK